MTKRILISGAGIAGPTLAYWLLHQGFEPVIVERAPRFREGGYIVDFWGIGFDVAERMGIVKALRERGYINDRAIFVRADGRRRSGFGAGLLKRALGDRFLSIQRGDLARIIYDLVRERLETIFDDEIDELQERDNGIDVRLQSGKSRAFDCVIGADGLHSKVRALAFGNGNGAEHFLGYYVAVFVSPGYSRREEGTYLSYAAPGKQISRFALRDDFTGFLFVFRRDKRDPLLLHDHKAQKQALYETYAAVDWREWPEIRAHLERAGEIYFDAVSQVDLPSWSKGRVALVGDAAYCPSLLAGEGSAFAMAGAYILAGELARRGDNHKAAFSAYEGCFRNFILRKQKSARDFAASFTPKTAFGLVIRDTVLNLASLPFVADMLMGRFVRDDFPLPKY